MKTENLVILGVGVLALALIYKKRQEKKALEAQNANNQTIAPMSDEKVKTCQDKVNTQRSLMKTTAGFDWIAWEKSAMQQCLAQ